MLQVIKVSVPWRLHSLSQLSPAGLHLSGHVVALLVLLSPSLLLDQPSFIRGSIWVIDGCLHHFFIDSHLVSMILLDLVALVAPSVEREFASLPESLLTPIYATNVRLLVGVDALVLLSVLVKRKPLVAEAASELLHL